MTPILSGQRMSSGLWATDSPPLMLGVEPPVWIHVMALTSLCSDHKAASSLQHTRTVGPAAFFAHWGFPPPPPGKSGYPTPTTGFPLHVRQCTRGGHACLLARDHYSADWLLQSMSSPSFHHCRDVMSH